MKLVCALLLLSAPLLIAAVGTCGDPECQNCNCVTGLSAKEYAQMDFLDRMNCARKAHGVDPIVYDMGLEDDAVAWSNQMDGGNCKSMKHSSSASRANPVGKQGENLCYRMMGGSTGYSLHDAMILCEDAWYNECKDYAGQYISSPAVGHFTQAMWLGTTKVGCGVCKNYKNGQNYVMITCRYNPAGNFMSQFASNVKKAVQKWKKSGRNYCFDYLKLFKHQSEHDPVECLIDGSGGSPTPTPVANPVPTPVKQTPVPVQVPVPVPVNSGGGGGSCTAKGKAVFDVTGIQANGIVLNGNWRRLSNSCNGYHVWFHDASFKAYAVFRSNIWQVTVASSCAPSGPYYAKAAIALPWCKVKLCSWMAWSGKWVAACGVRHVHTDCSESECAGMGGKESTTDDEYWRHATVEIENDDHMGINYDEEQAKLRAGYIYASVAVVGVAGLAVAAVATLYYRRRRSALEEALLEEEEETEQTL